MFDSFFFDNKTILITGGSGSIGGHLVDALLKTNCNAIRVLSNNEHELFLLEQKHKKNEKLRLFLGDVRDKERLKVATYNADIVFHAAALKHVPICEYNPLDAVQTNVIGTQNIIEACIESDVQKFCLISTDKATSPLSTLGATKLLAERLTISSMFYRKNDRLALYSVRFGNVIGTRGSVLELFLNQIHNDQPITITSKDMTRFTMTPNEAVDLILSTVSIAKGGEVFVLKMKVMRIIDLAKALLEIYKKSDDSIVEIGSRKGEKTHEELITEEEGMISRETDQMYIIPAFEDQYTEMSKLKTSYSSNSVTPLTIDEIKIYLKDFLI
jgi:UDP-N-acetylglucosamine 4,6-dehydratase/5-epimerase